MVGWQVACVASNTKRSLLVEGLAKSIRYSTRTLFLTYNADVE
jgi:hypothetical protein